VITRRTLGHKVNLHDPPALEMTRRQLIALAASALPVGCSRKSSPGEATPSPRPVPKKGLGLSEKMRPAQKNHLFLETVGAGWLYNWNVVQPSALPRKIPFSPMIYRAGRGMDKQLIQLKAQATEQNFTELLGFNEPDAKSQGNVSVEQALDAWPALEATGLRLGSPATVHPDNEWMIGFMKGVEQRGLRVDFICMHSYGGPGVDSLIRKIEKVHRLFQRPIWITEFAVADWKAESSSQNRFKPERIAAFVRQLLPLLESMDIVERYAWFHGGISGGPLASSQLFNPDDSLTVVGEAYRDAG